MGKIWARRWVSLAGLLGLTALATGCNQQDAEAMNRIGKKLAAVAGDIKDNLGGGWQGLYNSMGPEGRVATRVHWDKNLAEAKIQVKASGSDIELTGNVQNQEQKRRAVELAETTAGVDRVTDNLEVAN
jgi:hypothetical protein